MKESGTNPFSNQCLLSKSESTKHIPLSSKTKEMKRLYSTFDKEVASKLFGYRVNFVSKKMQGSYEAPKPLSKFVEEAVNDLTSLYV